MATLHYGLPHVHPSGAHVNAGSLVLLSLVPSLLNLIVLIGGVVWLIIARDRLGQPAIRLLGAGLALLTVNLFGGGLLNLSISESIGPDSDWHVQQILLTGALSAVIHAVGLGLIIAAALVRPPAGPHALQCTAGDRAAPARGLISPPLTRNGPLDSLVISL